MTNRAALELTTNRTRRLAINNDLQVLNQVLYLVMAELPPSDVRLKEFVTLGQAALYRLSATMATVDAPVAEPALAPVHRKRAADVEF